MDLHYFAKAASIISISNMDYLPFVMALVRKNWERRIFLFKISELSVPLNSCYRWITLDEGLVLSGAAFFPKPGLQSSV